MAIVITFNRIFQGADVPLEIVVPSEVDPWFVGEGSAKAGYVCHHRIEPQRQGFNERCGQAFE